VNRAGYSAQSGILLPFSLFSDDLQRILIQGEESPYSIEITTIPQRGERRKIIEDSTDEIVSSVQSEDYGITTVDATGSRGNVRIIRSLVNRADVSRITAHIQSTNPHAFYSIEDVRYVNKGVFLRKKPNAITGLFHSFIRPGRKNNLRISGR